MDSFGCFDRGGTSSESSSFSRNRFDRGMSEASTSSRASNLQKLMERETENIRQWKVDSERRLEEQQREIQTKAGIIGRLQKQLCATELEKEEATATLKQNDAKCRELSVRLGKFSSKYQRIVDGVAQRDKEEQMLKEQLEKHMEEKVRLKAELDLAAESLARIRLQIEDAKTENVDRFLQLRTEIGRREESNRELTAELAATKESQLLAVEKISFLEQEMTKQTTALTESRRDKEASFVAHAQERERLQSEIKEAAKKTVELEADLRDRGTELEEARTELEEARREEEEMAATLRATETKKTEAEDGLRECTERNAALEEEIKRVEEEKSKLVEDWERLTEELKKSTAALAGKSEECRLLVEGNREEMTKLGASLEAERDKSASLESETREREECLVRLEDKIQQLAIDEKKYQAEILFRHEQQQQREAEYVNLSEKLKEILGEKDTAEGQLVEMKAALAAEKEARLEEQKAKDAALRETASLSAEVARANERIDMSNQALDKTIVDKNTYETDCVHLRLSNKSLERQLETSEARCQALQEAEQRASAEADRRKAEVERLSTAASDAEAKWTTDAKKKAEDAQSERSNYDRVIDDLKTKHETARQLAVDLEQQLVEARNAIEEQTKEHQKAIEEIKDSNEKVKESAADLEKQLKEARKIIEEKTKKHEKQLEDIKKDRADVDKFNKSQLSRTNNEMKAVCIKLTRMTEKFNEKEKELEAETAKVAALREEAKENEAGQEVGGGGGAAAAAMAEQERRVAALEAEMKQSEQKARELEEERRITVERLEEEKRGLLTEKEAQVEALTKELSDIKLNLSVKENECKGLNQRIELMEAAAAAAVEDGRLERDIAVNTPATKDAGKLSQAVNSSSSSSSSSNRVPTAHNTPTKTPAKPFINSSTVPSPASSATSMQAPVLCTPAKSNVPPPIDNSPAIKRRSVVARSMTVGPKKQKVTFGGSTSRFISDQSDFEDSQGAADTFLSQLNPTTPHSSSVRLLRRLTTPSPKTYSAPGERAASAAASVEPIGAKRDGDDDDDAASVNSDGVIINAKMSRKFAELKAKNDVRRAEKVKARAEMKAKYGNKFNELKAKNEQKQKQKEALKAQKATAEANATEDEESSGCDWF